MIKRLSKKKEKIVHAKVQSVDFQNGVRYLNRMMGAWDAQGLALGYTKVSNPADPITVPDGALEGMVFNLAVRLAKQYDIKILEFDSLYFKQD